VTGESPADSAEQFVEAAAALARDVGRLRHLRRTMRDRLRASPLMNHAGFTSELEGACRRMWQAWCAA
jgi:predicted O-linked N-acetylglucosamine transferase (SPINDLY family)